MNKKTSSLDVSSTDQIHYQDVPFFKQVTFLLKSRFLDFEQTASFRKINVNSISENIYQIYENEKIQSSWKVHLL